MAADTIVLKIRVNICACVAGTWVVPFSMGGVNTVRGETKLFLVLGIERIERVNADYIVQGKTNRLYVK